MQEEPQSVWLELRGMRDILIQLRTMTETLVLGAKDHEERIRRLEERRFPLQSLAIIVAILSLAASIFFAVKSM